MKTHSDVALGDELVGNACEDLADDPGVEEGDVGDPGDAQDERAHK